MEDQTFYNEIDPDAAAWLRELIAEGHIAPGIVDERSIEDVRPDELTGFTQCHFFAGIGIWSLALRAAGIPDDYPIWTGSCPCQPFSSAGKGSGENDKRHLWPVFAKLIDACRPPAILGEQVASNLITGKRVSAHLQRLWERKARLGVLADWLEKDLSVALQGMPQQSGAGTASNAQGFNIKSGFPVGGRGQIPSGHEGITVRSDCIVGAESARLWSMRGHWNPVRHGDKTGLEYSFSGSDASREGLHAPEHAGGLVRLERGLRDLGGEQGDRDGQCHHEAPARAIKRASEATDRELEKEDGGAWIDTLQLDLEGMDYSFCCIPFPTAGVGGPHIRDRLYWGAFAAEQKVDGRGPAARARRLVEKNERYAQIRRDVMCHYGGPEPKCNCCGEWRYEFLALDHINGGGSAEKREFGSRGRWRQIQLAGYPPSYQVLCHNCNQAKHILGVCPHVTERVGDTGSKGLQGHGRNGDHGHQPGWLDTLTAGPIAAAGEFGRLANLSGIGRREERADVGGRAVGNGAQGLSAGLVHERSVDGLGHTDSQRTGWDGRAVSGQITGQDRQHLPVDTHASGCDGRLAIPGSERHDGRGTAGTAVSGRSNVAGHSSPVDGMADSDINGRQPRWTSTSPAGYRDTAHTNGSAGRPGPVNGFWRDADWLHCRDGKWRPVEPGTQPLAYGFPRSMGDLSPELQRLAAVAGLSKASLKRAKQFRVGSLRGYGNAINAIAAQAFIESILEPS